MSWGIHLRFRVVVFCALFTTLAQAHHTKDHMILLEDSAEVIAGAQPGLEGGTAWLLWASAVIFLVLGLVRWWNNRT